MSNTALHGAPVVASTPSVPARLHLVAVRVGRAVLDGGWWPRSWDVDLVIVPPGTADAEARAALARSADPADVTGAAGILAAMPILAASATAVPGEPRPG